MESLVVLTLEAPTWQNVQTLKIVDNNGRIV